MNGLITLWKGPINYNTYTSNNITYSYYTPTLSNWFICDGSAINDQFTTPNLVGYVPVGTSTTNGDNNGTVSLSENIPSNNHTHDITYTTDNIFYEITSVVNNIGSILWDTDTPIVYSTTDSSRPITAAGLHNHTLGYGTIGTTTINDTINISQSSDNTYKFNYVSQHYIIYYKQYPIYFQLFSGMVYNWYGSVNGITPNQPIDSNGNIYTNWYVCNGISPISGKTIPNFENKIAVVCTSTSQLDTVLSNTTTIRDPLPISSHIHSNSTNPIPIVITSSTGTTYDPIIDISVAYLTDLTIQCTTTTSSTVMIPLEHTHDISYSTYTYSNTTSTNNISDTIFKYINLYYIIYLPS